MTDQRLDESTAHKLYLSVRVSTFGSDADDIGCEVGWRLEMVHRLTEVAAISVESAMRVINLTPISVSHADGWSWEDMLTLTGILSADGVTSGGEREEGGPKVDRIANTVSHLIRRLPEPGALFGPIGDLKGRVSIRFLGAANNVRRQGRDHFDEMRDEIVGAREIIDGACGLPDEFRDDDPLNLADAYREVLLPVLQDTVKAMQNAVAVMEAKDVKLFIDGEEVEFGDGDTVPVDGRGLDCEIEAEPDRYIETKPCPAGGCEGGEVELLTSTVECERCGGDGYICPDDTT